MDFVLKNVGIIENATIKLDGLTVICGNNNSGKSTAGKALYCTIESLCNLSEKRNNELKTNYRRAALSVCRTIDLSSVARYVDFDKIQEQFQKNLSVLLQDGYSFRYFTREYDPYISFQELLDAVDFISPGLLIEFTKKPQNELPKKFFAYLNNLEENCEKSRKLLYGLSKYYYDDSWKAFVESSVASLFSSEFNGQVFPANKPTKDRKSFVSISKNGEVGTKIELIEKKGLIASVKGTKPFFNNVIYIEDPYILDKIADEDDFTYLYRPDSVLEYTHSSKLKTLLLKKRSSSLIEQSINSETYDYIVNKISDVIPGTISQRDSGLFYEEKGKEPLRVQNLATGSKMFSIVKNLIEKGEIAFDTMLILDEPEAHLHPEWQNIFAEVIVLLVKELDTHILLTTHSPNFLMAIEAFSQKYELNQKTHFYLSSHSKDNYLADYQCVDGKLGQIYSSFAYPLVKMKQLKEERE